MADTEESFVDRLGVIEEELGEHTARLRVKSQKYAKDAEAENDPVLKRVPTMGSDIVDELCDTSLDFQTEVVLVIREALEEGIGEELIGIEVAHADVILKPLVAYKAALTEWIKAQVDPESKQKLEKQLEECDAAIALVHELVLPEDKDEDDKADEASDEEPN